jgi:myo-inositol-hexaphosphate 3-phosphohydrolase
MLHFEKPATAGIHQNTDAGGLSIYPNPNNGMFSLVSAKATNGSIEVYNVLGERVFSRTETVFTNLQLDLGNLPSGVYYLSLKSGDGVRTLKFVVN